MKQNSEKGKRRSPQERDLLLLKTVYTLIGVFVLVVMQLAPFSSPQQRLKVSLIVLAVIFGVGFNATRNLKKAQRKD